MLTMSLAPGTRAGVHVEADDQAPSEALRIEGLAAKCGM
jgi:hypothetical protein